MIHVEYSFCKMRLPVMGFTLPWQLVAAQEPGPMYLLNSFCAARTAGRAIYSTQRTTRSMQEFEVSRTRSSGEPVCLYRLRRAEVNGPRCLFPPALRKATRILFPPE